MPEPRVNPLPVAQVVPEPGFEESLQDTKWNVEPAETEPDDFFPGHKETVAYETQNLSRHIADITKLSQQLNINLAELKRGNHPYIEDVGGWFGNISPTEPGGGSKITAYDFLTELPEELIEEKKELANQYLITLNLIYKSDWRLRVAQAIPAYILDDNVELTPEFLMEKAPEGLLDFSDKEFVTRFLDSMRIAAEQVKEQISTADFTADEIQEIFNTIQQVGPGTRLLDLSPGGYTVDALLDEIAGLSTPDIARLGVTGQEIKDLVLLNATATHEETDEILGLKTQVEEINLMWVEWAARYAAQRADVKRMKSGEMISQIEASLFTQALSRPAYMAARPFEYYAKHFNKPLTGHLYRQYLRSLATVGLSREKHERFEQLIHDARANRDDSLTDGGWTSSHWYALGEAWDDEDMNGVAKFAIEVIFDPLTYFGFGLYGRTIGAVPKLAGIGQKIYAAEMGFARASEIPFEWIRAIGIDTMPVTIAGRAQRSTLRGFTDLRRLAREAYNGQLFGKLTPGQLQWMGNQAIDLAVEQPQALDQWTTVGRNLLGPLVMTTRDIDGLFRSMGVDGIAHGLDKQMVGSVNNIMEKTDGFGITKFLMVEEATDLLLKAMNIPLDNITLRNIGKKFLQDKQNLLVSNAKRVLMGPDWKTISRQYMDHMRKKVTDASQAEIFNERYQQGMVASMFNSLDRVTRHIWFDVLDKFVSMPFARAYLLFGAYGPFNVMENAAKTMLSGISPIWRGNPFARNVVRFHGLKSEIPLEWLTPHQFMLQTNLPEQELRMLSSTQRLAREELRQAKEYRQASRSVSDVWERMMAPYWLRSLSGYNWASRVGGSAIGNYVGGMYMKMLAQQVPKELLDQVDIAVTNAVAGLERRVNPKIFKATKQELYERLLTGDFDLVANITKDFSPGKIIASEVHDKVAQKAMIGADVSTFLVTRAEDGTLWAAGPAGIKDQFRNILKPAVERKYIESPLFLAQNVDKLASDIEGFVPTNIAGIDAKLNLLDTTVETFGDVIDLAARVNRSYGENLSDDFLRGLAYTDWQTKTLIPNLNKLHTDLTRIMQSIRRDMLEEIPDRIRWHTSEELKAAGVYEVPRTASDVPGGRVKTSQQIQGELEQLDQTIIETEDIAARSKEILSGKEAQAYEAPAAARDADPDRGLKELLEMAAETMDDVPAAPAAAAPQLPQNLRGAKPRFGDFEIDWLDDTDLALYIIARREGKLSRKDVRYMTWLKEQYPGVDEAEIIRHGKSVKEALKQQVQETAEGTRVKFPPTGRQLLTGETEFVPEYMSKFLREAPREEDELIPDLDQFVSKILREIDDFEVAPPAAAPSGPTRAAPVPGAVPFWTDDMQSELYNVLDFTKYPGLGASTRSEADDIVQAWVVRKLDETNVAKHRREGDFVVKQAAEIDATNAAVTRGREAIGESTLIKEGVSDARRATYSSIIASQESEINIIQKIGDELEAVRMKYFDANGKFYRTAGRRDDEWYGRFFEEWDKITDDANEARLIQRDKTFSEVNRVSGIGRAIGRTTSTEGRTLRVESIDASGRTLTPADVARVFGITNDDLQRNMIMPDLMAIRGRSSFVHAVKRRVSQLAKPDDIGFTDDAIGTVYDQMMFRLSADPKVKSGIEPALIELQDLENEIIHLGTRRNSLMPDDAVDYINKSVVPSLRRVDALQALRDDAFQEMREEAMRRTVVNHGQDFPDYSNETMLSSVMKTIFPFWTYEAHRWAFYLPREALRHPGTFATWGKYMDNSDQGYTHIPGTSIDLNPLRGTIAMGGLRRLFVRDYPEFYDRFEGLSSLLDTVGRFGFYPGAAVGIPLSIFGAKSGMWQLGEVMPTWQKTVLSSLAVVLPNSEAVKVLQDIVFSDRFRDFTIANAVSAEAIQNEREGREGVNGVYLLEKKLRGESFTEEEEVAWDSGRRSIGFLSIMAEQTSIMRIKPEEKSKVQKAARTALSELTDVPEYMIEDMRRAGVRFEDIFGALPPDVHQQLSALEGWDYFAGASITLQPSELGVKMAIGRKFWKAIEHKKTSIKERMAVAEIQLQRGFINMKTWLFKYREANKELVKYMDELRGTEENPTEYTDVPITLSERVEWSKKYNLPEPIFHAAEELRNLYFEKELDEVYNFDTGLIEPDWDSFFAYRDVLEQSAASGLFNELQALNNRDDTNLMHSYKEASRGYFRAYNGLFDIVLEGYDKDEQRKIRQFKSTDEPSVRDAMRLELTSHPDEKGQLLIASFTRRLRLAHENLRELNPELDAWLLFFGKVQTPKTPEALRHFNQLRRDHDLPVSSDTT